MNHRELAENNFLAGYNCAQSVLLAFAEDLGLDGDFALRLSSSFGGGMGRLREVCGAVSAILMAAGLVYGYTAPGDDGAKAAHYARVQALAGARLHPLPGASGQSRPGVPRPGGPDRRLLRRPALRRPGGQRGGDLRNVSGRASAGAEGTSIYIEINTGGLL